MNTPIFDFVNEYHKKQGLRLHMPGHKGRSYLGCEPWDITEIDGADNLYTPEDGGIIKTSEANATGLFGTGATLYSTGGSSQCIGAMLYLTLIHHKKKDGKNIVLAGRNAHKTFVQNCGLLGIEAEWMYPKQEDAQGLCSCNITKEALAEKLSGMTARPMAVYITSPDYLGNIADIRGIADVCKGYQVPLLVDNAHGAYLKFLPISRHPMDSGATMCCDSAHKTLSVLTGGAYLHMSRDNEIKYEAQGKVAMSLFGSTSPSYLILQSLDLCNRRLSGGYRADLAQSLADIMAVKVSLLDAGINVLDTEPLKIVIDCKEMGVYPDAVAGRLRTRGIEAEFIDQDFLVFMITPEIKQENLLFLQTTLLKIFSDNDNRMNGRKEDIVPIFTATETVMTIRDALLSLGEVIEVDGAEGRVCRTPSVSCPPAIPIGMSGERLSRTQIALFRYYGITHVDVIKISED